MKDHLILAGLITVGVLAIFVIRDNMPKSNFSFKK